MLINQNSLGNNNIYITKLEEEMMSREKMLEMTNEVFCDLFDDEDIIISEVTVADDIEDWDSLEHINLVLAIEERFGMKFTMGEVTGMKNVGDMIDILMERAVL